MPKISVIVPVYNVEKYIDRCIESIAKQSFPDFECILVNDCTKDNSGKICDETARKDSRFIVVHKPQNEGLPKARKTGLDIARGDFIIHIDSDDWLALNAFELLVEKQQETNADVVLPGFEWINPDGSSFEHIYPEIPKNISAIEYFLYYRSQNIWAKLIKKKLYKDIIVPPYSMGEDIMFNTQIFSRLTDISQIAKVDYVIYYYDRRNESSFTNITSHMYKNYTDDPRIICRLWAEKYLYSLNADDKTINAFRFYMIVEGIAYSLHNNKFLSQESFNALYRKYYLPFTDKAKLGRGTKILIGIAKISIVLARIYLFLLNVVKAIITFLRFLVRKIR